MSARRRPGGRRNPPGAATDPLEVALRLLGRRSRTEAEIRTELGRQNVEREETERVVGILREKGLLDDAAVAREFIATRSGRLGHGRLRLLADLLRRGVSPEVAEAAWAEAVRGGDVDPAEAVRRAARRAVSRRGGRLDRRSYPRVYNALLRQGFDPDAVRAALAEFRTAAGGEADSPDDVP